MDKNKLKKFINNWEFPNPDWSNIPNDFPKCNIDNLTIEEKWVYEGIKTVWYFDGNGKNILYKKALKTLATFTVFVLIIVGLVSMIAFSASGQFTSSVNAATISASLKQVNQKANDVIQSTMSGLLIDN